jgi:hypothetical protein
MSPFNLVSNTGYYGPDYTGLFYCILGLSLLFWGIRGLYRTRKANKNRQLAMDKTHIMYIEKLTAIRNHLEAVPKGLDHDISPWDLSPVSLNNLMRALFEILDAKDHGLCANCGAYTDNFCIIEKGPPDVNWIEDAWVKMGVLGKPICGECYYQ